MGKPFRDVRVKGVGTSRQVRYSLAKKTIPGFNVGLKLSGVDAADLLTDLDEATALAAKLVAERLGEALDQAISAAVWAWDTGGTRNIIDTGKLMASRQITVTGNRIDIQYNVPYAGLVHYGGYILPYGNVNASKVYLPGRPWLESVVLGGGPVPEFNYEEIYAQAIEQAFR
jgi:hypothetical protein